MIAWTDRARFARQVEAVHALGSRPMGELLLELAKAGDCADALDTLLARYATISPEMVRLVGGDRLPRHVPRQVPRDTLADAA